MSNEDCLFCKIAGGEMGTEFLAEDDRAVVFKDINPQAPQHFLVIPKRHVASIAELQSGDEELMGHLFLLGAKVARDLGLSEYRTVVNCGEGAGQSVFHVHVHFLGGRPMQWPPG